MNGYHFLGAGFVAGVLLFLGSAFAVQPARDALIVVGMSFIGASSLVLFMGVASR